MSNSKNEVYGTFGPSCKSREVLEEMIRCGMTGMRLNLSHTTLEKSKEYLDNYKEATERCGVSPQILIDMQGPELRIGKMEEQRVCAGDSVFFVSNAREAFFPEVELTSYMDDEKRVQIPIPGEVLKVLEPEMEILLDDGKIRVQVEHVRDNSVMAKVIIGGIIKPQKSIKVVGHNVEMPILTNHDLENIRQAKRFGVTALMQPFVFSGEDLRRVRSVLKEEKAEYLQLFAKIENCKGVENLDSIIPEADLIVIARGDLGNDMPLWELPRVQKKIEEACKRYGKPYMVVTQMLASMEENPMPTRAEVSDIFHAVYHGARAVMVTGETAVGKYPVEVIRYLANTAKEAMKCRSVG